MSAIQVQDLGKVFRTYRSEFQRVGRWLGIATKAKEEYWALRHVDFEIRKGESIGIIGQNGAGKSCLLKMITGTLYPTEGEVKINGQVAAILELGMLFNAELTGRQNALHAAGLMGLSAEQIRRVMPDIEAFAEIGEYFDEPVRTYSTGMQVRVAFSVAVAYRPEILIIDEVLSVGDAYFQHKSFSRIREFQEQGTTLLIVSHDKTVIQNMCNRGLLLENGKLIKGGNPEEVFDFYNALIAEKEKMPVQVTLPSGKLQTTSGSGEAKIEEVVLYNSKGEITESVTVGEKIELRIKVKVYQAIENLVLGFGIRDRLGQVMYGTNTYYTKQIIHSSKAGNEYLFKITFPSNFGVGSYSVQVALHDRETHLSKNYEWRDIALIFDVSNAGRIQFDGCTWIQPEIEIDPL
jgi:lipopolysaccharide transport system ATP-binding protein